MYDDGSKDNRSKAKEALLDWVRKKTTGYVIHHLHLDLFFFVCEYFSLNKNLDFIHHLIYFGEIIC
jgi:hypothetical protein